MTSEVVYFCGPDGASTALQVLEHLHSKTLARSLAFIDLLEESDLPRDIDRQIGGKQSLPDEKTHQREAAEHTTPNNYGAHGSLRALNAFAGRTKLRFAYTRFDGKSVILGVGQQARGSELAKLVQDYERSLTAKPKAKHAKEGKPGPCLKSHREFVAELTLSDPVLAAHYSKARERAQFALSMIKLRDKAQFTNEALAERTGLSLTRVKSLTRGRLPKLDTMRRLVDALQARIVIAPGGGITLEACEPDDAPRKRFTSQKPILTHTKPEPTAVADLLLIQ
jgi:hypothetical protein